MIRSRRAVWGLWLTAYALTTLVLSQVAERPDIRVAHGVLAYLVLIVGASRQGGRALSLVMIVLGYVAVKFLLIPPRLSFGVASDLDWFIVFGFTAAGLLISELFTAQQRAVQLAEERAREVERLSTERLQLEREASMARVLRETDRFKNALLGSIAHDLRSPVATLSLLADPAAGIAEPVALQRISEEAHRLGEFIHTLQRFASDGGGSGFALVEYDVTLLVQAALRSSEAMLAGREVRVEAPRLPLYAACDLTLSVQVLGNLLQNAARYAPPRTPIDLVVRERPDAVELVVRDRGPGVPPAEVERLFTPMRRRIRDEDHTGAGDEGRMGMGLSIARTFARAQRGDVTYRPREGGGAEFTVTLPRVAAAQRA